MENTNSVFLKGHMLIAMPGLADPNFAQSVTCICEHSGEGAVGIIVNRLHPFLSGKEVFDELQIDCTPDMESIPIHIGGPVHMGEVFVLHGPPFDWNNSFPVNDHIALSSTIDVLQAISKGEGPASYLIATGCAGWAPGQLESEMLRNSWITCPFDEKLLFDSNVEERWEISIRSIGIDPGLLSENIGHA